MGISPSPHDLYRHLTIAFSGLATAFTRLRRWSPQSVVTAVLLLTRPDQRSSYSTLLTSVAEESFRLLGWSTSPAKSSLTAARRKVSVATFRAVLHQLVEHLSGLLPGDLRHHGDRRFIAVDATSLVCPRSPSLLKDLARPHVNTWFLAHYPRALVVVAFDVIRRLPLEWVMLPKGRGERAAMTPLLGTLRRKDVVILDRGYPARWLLGSVIEHGVDVVMRMTAAKAGSWPEVQRFINSGAKTTVIAIDLGRGKTAEVRLIRRNPPRGRPLKHQRREIMVVLTTLLPRHGFEAKDILDLYGRRWDIESLFREMKEAFTIERFHAKSLDGIQQEIATVLMWIALTAVVQAAVQEGLTDGKRANRAACREAARVSLVNAIAGRPTNIERLITEARRHAYKPRPGRSFPRESKLPFGRFRNRGDK
jgi:hypothetical protein